MMPFADPLFGMPSWLDAIVRVVLIVLAMTLVGRFRETFAHGAIVEKFRNRRERAQVCLELILRHDEQHHKFHQRIVQSLELDAAAGAPKRRDHLRHALARRMGNSDAETDARAHRFLSCAQCCENGVAIRLGDLSVRHEEIHEFRDCRVPFRRLHLGDDRVSGQEIA